MVSSSSASLTDYRAALTAPGALIPALASALGRFPIAMVGLATLLYVQRVTGSFAAAGLVSAGMLAGVALGSVAQGRLMDRIGPTRPLLVAAVLFGLAEAVLVVAVQSGTELPLQRREPDARHTTPLFLRALALGRCRGAGGYPWRQRA